MNTFGEWLEEKHPEVLGEALGPVGRTLGAGLLATAGALMPSGSAQAAPPPSTQQVQQGEPVYLKNTGLKNHETFSVDVTNWKHGPNAFTELNDQIVKFMNDQRKEFYTSIRKAGIDPSPNVTQYHITAYVDGVPIDRRVWKQVAQVIQQNQGAVNVVITFKARTVQNGQVREIKFPN
jgi:hypothetical protein